MIDLVYKVAAFLVTLGVLVIIHELGHYFVARWCGVRVVRFSVGFGRVIASRRIGRDQTEWALSAIPLGGYVKMADEREGEVAAADLPRAFNRQSVGKRIAIVAAGPIANLLLAVLLFAGTFLAGIPGYRALLADPPPASAAHAAGIRAGDRVVAVDGAPVQTFQDLRWRLLEAQGKSSVELAVNPADARENAAPILRVLAIDALQPGDWETNPLTMLGLKADFGAPTIEAVIADKPAARAGLERGDRIVSVDGRTGTIPRGRCCRDERETRYADRIRRGTRRTQPHRYVDARSLRSGRAQRGLGRSAAAGRSGCGPAPHAHRALRPR